MPLKGGNTELIEPWASFMLRTLTRLTAHFEGLNSSMFPQAEALLSHVILQMAAIFLLHSSRAIPQSRDPWNGLHKLWSKIKSLSVPTEADFELVT